MPTYGTSKRDTTGLPLLQIQGTTGSDNDVLLATDLAIDKAAVAAGFATTAATGDNAPQALIDVIPGAWSWDITTGVWAERFNGNAIVMYFSIAAPLVNVKVTCRDVAGAGGELTFQVDAAYLFVPPTPKSYTPIGSTVSAGTGLDQEITIPVTWVGMAPAELRLTVTTGTINGGAALANQYQVQQIRWTTT